MTIQTLFAASHHIYLGNALWYLICFAILMLLVKHFAWSPVSEMMEKLLDYMDVDIQNSLNRIMKVLPEISYSIVGILLIFLVVVVLVPCIQMYMSNWLIDAYQQQGII